MDTNIIRSLFIFNTIFTGGFGLLINYAEPYLPTLLTRTYRYGKYSVRTHQAIVEKFEVPKRWFRHFYIFAGPASTIVLCLVAYKYFYNGTLPEIVFILLDILFGRSRKSLVSKENTLLAIIILNIQCWKRAYETCYVNIFSDRKIHTFHYLAGFIHYLGTLLCVIGESEGFVRHSHANLFWRRSTTVKLVCAFIFLWSAYMQLKTNFILAKLRKSKHDAAVVSYDYKIPIDGLFKYTSSPLQFTEILMYLMLSAILWQASTYHYITIWVIVNQVECAYLSHRWYHDTFKNYPKKRKILIPYIW